MNPTDALTLSSTLTVLSLAHWWLIITTWELGFLSIVMIMKVKPQSMKQWSRADTASANLYTYMYITLQAESSESEKTVFHLVPDHDGHSHSHMVTSTTREARRRLKYHTFNRILLRTIVILVICVKGNGTCATAINDDDGIDDDDDVKMTGRVGDEWGDTHTWSWN